ncbi:MAG: hypothetical protein FJ318_06785 [SAR202 cluster bacterium]|nr:hypothetical protein [SAR202 cluster bacterium]
MYVKDVAASTEFYEKAVHLEVSEQRGDKVFLRGGMPHHWIAIQLAPVGKAPGLAALGIEVKGKAALDEVAEKLRARGIPFRAGDGLEAERVAHSIHFDDPSGNPLTVYTDMVSMPTPPAPRRVEFLDIQHVVLLVGDIDRAVDFYGDVLGMRVSDWFEHTTAFMHFANGWHHGIGLGSGMGRGTSGLNHICFHTPDLDTTMRARATVQRLGLKITSDLLKHGPSTSTGFYFQGPDTIIENSFGARWFDVDQPHTPRILPRTRESVDVHWAGLENLELGYLKTERHDTIPAG